MLLPPATNTSPKEFLLQTRTCPLQFGAAPPCRRQANDKPQKLRRCEQRLRKPQKPKKQQILYFLFLLRSGHSIQFEIKIERKEFPLHVSNKNRFILLSRLQILVGAMEICDIRGRYFCLHAVAEIRYRLNLRATGIIKKNYVT